MLAFMAGARHAGVAASQGDAVFALQDGRVAVHAAVTTRSRELRASISGRSLARTAAQLLGPKAAHAACPVLLAADCRLCSWGGHLRRRPQSLLHSGW
jgi:hypothetical protein